MSGKLLLIGYKFNVPASDYKQAVAPLADPIAAVPGLRWKIWPINEAESTGGGVFLFDDKGDRTGRIIVWDSFGIKAVKKTGTLH